MKKRFETVIVAITITILLSFSIFPPATTGLGDKPNYKSEAGVIQAMGMYEPTSFPTWFSCDITGDSINDTIITIVSYDLDTYMPVLSEIKAVNGTTGELLWIKKFPSCEATTIPIGDLNGDNKSDVIIEVSMDESIGIIGVNGYNGTEFWDIYIEQDSYRPKVMVAQPANLISANRRDAVITVWTYSYLGSRTDVIGIKGSDGRELWGKYFDGLLLDIVPVDLTNDGKDEVVIGSSTPVGWLSFDDFIFTHPNVIALNGNNGTEIWSNHYPEEATFSIENDLTGDGAYDLIVLIGGYKLGVLRGYDGKLLWTIEI